MKTIDEILNNYSDYETTIEDRLGARLCEFLTQEQAEQIGFSIEEGYDWTEPKAWTEENILQQLKEDVLFGWEKACGHRGISSGLMYEVVRGWLEILEVREFMNWSESNYAPYGTPLFLAVAEHYGWYEINPDDYDDGDWS